MRWAEDTRTLPLALSRMLLQLIMIGYVLTYIFQATSFYLIVLVLSVMLIAASIISLRPLVKKGSSLYKKAFIAIFVGSSFTLFIIMIAILEVDVWYEPKLLIPLAGMTFSASMNAISIAAERFESEMLRKNNYTLARNIAYKAALIPVINALFAVGLVSLPGMMSGQILAGVDPMIAVRYQIMVMLMLLSAAGLSTMVYLLLIKTNMLK